MGEKPRLPLQPLLLAGRGLLALALFELLLQLRRLVVLPVQYGFRDTLPKPPAFVPQLLGLWGDDLGQGPEGFEVDEELGFLVELF